MRPFYLLRTGTRKNQDFGDDKYSFAFCVDRVSEGQLELHPFCSKSVSSSHSPQRKELSLICTWWAEHEATTTWTTCSCIIITPFYCSCSLCSSCNKRHLQSSNHSQG